jgi:hypothetical protein
VSLWQQVTFGPCEADSGTFKEADMYIGGGIILLIIIIVVIVLLLRR